MTNVVAKYYVNLVRLVLLSMFIVFTVVVLHEFGGSDMRDTTVEAAS